MAKLTVEIVHPIRFLKEHRTFDLPVVRVGRGYDNDLILSDPHVSARHLIIRCEEEGWLVENTSHENRMYVRKYAKVMDEVLLQSGDEITIGRTRLRLFHPGHTVVPAKLLMPASGFFKKISQPVNMCSILIVGFLVFAFHVHLTSSENFSVFKLSAGALGFVAAALVWAGAWAFVGRLIRHNAQFAAQLSLSILFLALLLPTADMSEYLGYFTNSVTVEAVSTAILLGSLCTAFLIGSLTVATHVSSKKKIVVCTGICLVIISVVVFLYYTFKDEFNPYPRYYATLKPPFAKIPSGRPVDWFLTETADIFDFSAQNKKVLWK